MPYRDPERRKQYARDWMRRNPERARAAMRRWRHNHPAEHAAASRLYYARNPKHVQQIIDASPNRRAVRRAADQRRRARLLGRDSFTAGEWLALVAAHAGRCAYCGIEAPLHADHRIPLARGGAATIDNILPACVTCNLRKAQMTEEEFRARLASDRPDP